MSEYDAFGRKKGDDPLANLGGEPVERPPAQRIATPAPPPRRRGAGLAASIVAVVVVGIVGAAGLAVFSVAGTGVDEFEGVPAAETPRPVEPEPAPAVPPKGLEPGSLIRRDELTKALQVLRAAELGGIVSLRVDPEDVSAQVKTRQGYLRHATVTHEGLTKGSPSGPGFDHIETIAGRRIDPAAPERLVRAAARRLGRSPGEADYLVLMNLGKPTWGLFFKDGVHFQGTTAGKIIRRTN